MAAMLSISVVLTLVIHVLFASDTTCTEAFQCTNQSTMLNIYDDNIFNRGYKSHIGPLSAMSASGIYCQGTLACTQSSTMFAGVSIYCDGSLACSSSNIDTTVIHARAMNAISYSDVSVAMIRCHGEQSCAYSVMRKLQVVEGWGSYSLLNSVLDSINGPGTMTVQLYGYRSGFGATVICRAGHKCPIYCSSTACTNMHLNCTGNCTFIHTTSTLNRSLSFKHIEAYDSQNDDKICSSQSDTMNFDDYEDHYQATEIIGSFFHLCCRGEKACYGVTNIDYTSATGQSIICSAHASCARSSGKIHTTGSISCGGRYSCTYSSITTDTVYCNGQESCARANEIKASVVYCNGYYACAYSSIISNTADLHVYLLGYKAGTSANIVCSASHNCWVYCMGYQSCLDLELTCTGLCNVCCDEDSNCPKGWITNACVTEAFISSHPPIIYSSSIPNTTPITMENTVSFTTSEDIIPSIDTSSSTSVFEAPNASTDPSGTSVFTTARTTNITSMMVSELISSTEKRYNSTRKRWSNVSINICIIAIVCGLALIILLLIYMTRRNTMVVSADVPAELALSQNDSMNKQPLPKALSLSNPEDSELWRKCSPTPKEGVMVATDTVIGRTTTVSDKEHEKKETCKDCGLRKAGKLYSSSGYFHCYDCLAYYTNDGEEGFRNVDLRSNVKTSAGLSDV